jgi:hypothetical protein
MDPCQWIKEVVFEADWDAWDPEVRWKPESKQSPGYNLLLESCRKVVSALVPLVLIYNNFLLPSSSSIKALVCSINFLLQTGFLYRRGAHNLVINHISLFVVAVCFWSLGHLWSE